MAEDNDRTSGQNPENHAPDKAESRKWQPLHTVGLLIFIVGLFVVSYFGPHNFMPRLQGKVLSVWNGFFRTVKNPLAPVEELNLVMTWLAIIGLLSATLMVISSGTTGKGVKGVLVDNRNQMSLSRLQLVAWTLLIISAFLTLAMFRLANSDQLGQPAASAVEEKTAVSQSKAEEENRTENETRGPLDVDIPAEVWGLLGISTGSLVGAAKIKSIKSGQDPPADAGAKITAINEKTGKDLVTQGTLVANKKVDAASVADLFQGDEIADALTLDIGKVQLFLFTLLAIVGYGMALGALFYFDPSDHTPSTVPSAFPEISAGILVLLGISHAGYLGDKYIPSTDTKPTDTT